jgi:hypothetical protein
MTDPLFHAAVQHKGLYGRNVTPNLPIVNS